MYENEITYFEMRRKLTKARRCEILHVAMMNGRNQMQKKTHTHIISIQSYE